MTRVQPLNNEGGEALKGMHKITTASSRKIEAAESPVTKDRIAADQGPILLTVQADAPRSVTRGMQYSEMSCHIAVFKKPVCNDTG
jgi:hypothetical protein